MIFTIGIIMFLVGGFIYDKIKSPLGPKFNTKIADLFLFIGYAGIVCIIVCIIVSLCKLAIKFLP